MNTAAKPSTRAGRYLRALTGLLLISGAATLAVTWMERNTRAAIAANEQAQKLAMLATVLPAGTYDNYQEQAVSLLNDSKLAGSSDPQPVYSARKNGEVVASVLTVTAPDGYTGPIQLLVGISRDGTLTGVRVIRHRETPGLGDRIDPDKSNWINIFNGLGSNAGAADVALREDGGTIDHITGATITSRAVTNAVANALLLHAKNRALLLAPLDATNAPETLAP
jgi:electron transport complex protein RnfG